MTSLDSQKWQWNFTVRELSDEHVRFEVAEVFLAHLVEWDHCARAELSHKEKECFSHFLIA
ncbi:hypothetical protein WL47_00320 [Burkholderia ubonensis]|nr:hypothetical protein WL47_00320 [Burkholderia ubonensis]